MRFEDNPADDRYQLDQCIDEIKSLQSRITILTAERDATRKELTALRSAPGMEEVERITEDHLFSSGEDRVMPFLKMRDIARRAIASRKEVVGLLKWLKESGPVTLDAMASWGSEPHKSTSARILEIMEGKR